jgi:thiosulfate reductase/polysulfide reductase chain A
MSTTRREFIKISGLGAAGLAVAGSAIGQIAKAKAEENSGNKDAVDGLERTPTYCEVCFWKCAGWVYKDDQGEIQKIIGNDEDQHSMGRFCPRGTGGVGMYHDEDRLKKPMIREKGEGGEAVFREVEWKEAFDYIAKKLKMISRKYGPETLALFSHGSGGKFWGPFIKAYGSGTQTAPSWAQCKGPREVAFEYTFGEELHSPEPTDIRDTKCLVLIGNHIGENMHNGLIQEMSDAIDKGASIITVDPRYSTAASKSKFWLPIKPSTDIALLLAWIHVLINEGWYDKEYVEKYTLGFEQLKAHVQQFTPEWAYGKTTIKPEDIRATAREMYNNAPATLIHPGRHVTWYGDDTQRLRAMAILNALLGSYGRRGGFYRAEKFKLPKYPAPKAKKAKKSWKDAKGDKYPLTHASLAQDIRDASIPSEKRDLTYKAWIVNGSNLIDTLPNTPKTIEAIQHLELLVVIDTMPMDITGYADVILPECTYLERYDMLRVAGHREPAIALRMPAVEPKYDSKPGWWMVKQLATKMYLGSYFPYKNIEQMLDWQLKKAGSSLKEMQKIGVKTFPRKYDDLYFGDGEDIEFNTASGKIELYSSEFEEYGFDPMPNYTDHPEPQENFYRLIYGRAPMHTFSRTANNPNLTDLMDENNIWVNPRVAEQWGLKNGQRIRLKNQDGVESEFAIPVRITERIRWDSIYMVHGFGHSRKEMKRAYGKGISDTELITNVMHDPIMGGTGMRGNFVTFLLDEKEAES